MWSLGNSVRKVEFEHHTTCLRRLTHFLEYYEPMRRDHRVYLAVIHRQRGAAVTHIVSSIDGGVAVENLLPSARRQAPRIGAENIPVIKRRVIQTRQNQQLLASSATRER